MPKNRKPRNGSLLRPLAEIDSERERLPVDRVELSAEERTLLKDPEWIDEDEADAILIERIIQKEGHTAIPFREYLRRNGRTVED
jgi:hypothetical protein